MQFVFKDIYTRLYQGHQNSSCWYHHFQHCVKYTRIRVFTDSHLRFCPYTGEYGSVKSSIPEYFAQRKVPQACNFMKKETLPQACNFIEKETLAQVLSCKFCKISKNTFSYRTPLVAAM